ncbi:sideroflexin-2-like [Ptychodera flava]|uniref:sideroflexin-2-like n=1 Tax=Ptychodera flava TaxID=63121 RepID=UPI00396A42F2
MANQVDGESQTVKPRIDIDAPRWDQSTFTGRLKHFFNITDPRTLLCSEKELDNAKELVSQYRLGTEPTGTTEEQLYYAQKLYMSAFHPDSGEKQNLIGRMSCQVPGGMIITGGMLQFYKTWSGVVAWQWINQSFNALVNYTNRNAASPITNKQIGLAYVTATSSALITAIGLNSLVKTAPPLLARYVPFAAVASANCVNIPMMRQRELLDGIILFDDNGNQVGKSQKAARKAIGQVVFSRITMAAPGMLILPIIMERLEKYNWFRSAKFLHAPFQTLAVGCFLLFMTPTACSLFPQKCSMKVSKLEENVRLDIQEKYGDLDTVYFNKGL